EERGAVGGAETAGRGGGLGEPQAEHHTLAPLNLERKRLELALGSASGEQGRDVPLQARRVAPTAALDCRNRTDPNAEVVAAQPVGPVVARAEGATVCKGGPQAEVRKLAPAVPGSHQAPDPHPEVQ